MIDSPITVSFRIDNKKIITFRMHRHSVATFEDDSSYSSLPELATSLGQPMNYRLLLSQTTHDVIYYPSPVTAFIMCNKQYVFIFRPSQTFLKLALC